MTAIRTQSGSLVPRCRPEDEVDWKCWYDHNRDRWMIQRRDGQGGCCATRMIRGFELDLVVSGRELHFRAEMIKHGTITKLIGEGFVEVPWVQFRFARSFDQVVHVLPVVGGGVGT